MRLQMFFDVIVVTRTDTHVLLIITHTCFASVSIGGALVAVSELHLENLLKHILNLDKYLFKKINCAIFRKIEIF